MVDHAAGPADREAYRRDCVIDKAQYLSREFADAEAEHLWPRVWQVACREEEIPRPGNYIAYDIVDDSIIVTRGEDEEIRALHNVCHTRGRRLVGRNGSTRDVICGYPGRRWKQDGRKNNEV